MKSVAFRTLGCKLNFSETSTIARTFTDRGYKKVNFEDGADIYVINTCTVTDNADKKCRKIIRDAQKYSENPFVIIVGCYAQLKPVEISGIQGVNLVLGANEKFKLLDYLDDLEINGSSKVFVEKIDETNEFHHSYSLNDRTRTFLKIQDGCDYSCTFCTIPLARGKSRSDTIEHVVKSAIEIAEKGVKEIVLTGVNTGDFGIHLGERQDRFIDLIRKLDEVDGIKRFRISSVEPNLLTDEIIDFTAASEKFVPHFHIPLQSGSDKILKLMRRRYLRELYKDRISKINTTIPDCGIGVDVIVGFPGERRQDFLDSYQFINDLDISYLHVFTYSERANTPAIEMEGRISSGERQERSGMLRSLSLKKKRHFYQQRLGTIKEVLFENDFAEGRIHGFTGNYIRVGVPSDPQLINQLVKVKLTGINEQGIVEGELVTEYARQF
ncbi:tRNA (N(6)-L-threonylcarbamoyladenosine(37)-C(2))-methylthiotransferase MtaB [Bacteroidota bacterium]